MMTKKYHTTHQYEPIQVPARFGDEMQRFVNRLTEIYDDIYRRYGRLGLNDISTAFGDALDVIRERIAVTESSVTAVSKKANSAWDAASVNSRDILALQNEVRNLNAVTQNLLERIIALEEE